MRLAHTITVPLLVGTLLLAGCSSSPLSYDERRDHLRKVAVRGAETHALIASSEGKPDEKRCKAAHAALNDDTPGTGVSGENPEWFAQVEAFFVDSCVSGKPKELPPLGPPATVAPTGTPTDSPSPSPSADVSITP